MDGAKVATFKGESISALVAGCLPIGQALESQINTALLRLERTTGEMLIAVQSCFDRRSDRQRGLGQAHIR